MCNLTRMLIVLMSGLPMLWSVQMRAAEPPEIANPSQAVEMSSSRLVDVDLFTNTTYQLDPTVTLYRSRAFFELTGPSATSVVISTRQLLARVDEIRATQKLEAMKKTKVYGEALKNAGMAPINLGKNLVTKPVDTVGRVGRGIGGFFSDIGYSIAGGDPDQENAAKAALGFDAAKRAFAFELGVNPYSNFEPLQDALGEVAWTSVGGNFTMSMGFRAVGGTAGSVLSLSKLANGMRKLVRDHSPRELKNINADKLAGMGVGKSLTEAFLSNHRFDPETETRLVGALESMANVAGRDAFIKRAIFASTPADARMMRDWAELMAAFHDKVQPLVGILVLSSAPLAVLADQVVQNVYPADYVAMSPGLEARQQTLVNMIQARGLKLGETWVPGGADPQIEGVLLKLGWAGFKTGVADQLYRE